MLTAHIPVPPPSLAAPLPVGSWRGYPGSLQVDDFRPRPEGSGAAPPSPPASGLALPPSSNTGAKCQSVSDGYNFGPDSPPLEQTGMGVKVDWLQGVIVGADLRGVRKILAHVGGVLGEEWDIKLDEQWFCGKRYDSSARGVATGCRAGWTYGGDPDPETGEVRPGELLISLPGKALARTSGASVHRLAQWLRDWGMRLTRADTAVDDFERTLSIDLVRQAAASGNAAGFKTMDSRQVTRCGQVIGDGVTLGSRKSDHLVRIYDKALESKGAINSIRIESELHDEQADLWFAEYCNMTTEQLHTGGAVFLAAVPLGKVKFLDKASGDRLSRRKMLGWWADFVARVGVLIRIGSYRVPPSLERLQKWHDSQVAISLAVLQEAWGDRFGDYIAGLIRDGTQRMKERHHALARIGQDEGWFPA